MNESNTVHIRYTYGQTLSAVKMDNQQPQAWGSGRCPMCNKYERNGDMNKYEQSSYAVRVANVNIAMFMCNEC